MKIKYIFAVPFLAILLYLIISSSSCNDDNPVIPPPPPVTEDTTDQYSWRLSGVGPELHQSYVADTNRIYLFYGGQNVFVYSGGSYGDTLHPVIFANSQFFAVNALNSPSGNTCFLGGNLKNNRFYPAIEKMQNGIFTETYEASSDTSNSAFMAMTFEDENNAWLTMGSGCNSFYHFSSGSFKEYKIDTNFIGISIFNLNNIIYLFGSRKINSNPNNYDIAFSSYIFRDNNFELLSTDTMINQGGFLSTLINKTTDNNLILSGPNDLKYFNGTRWKHLAPNPFINGEVVWELCGYSKDSLLTLGSFPKGFAVGKWNGINWKAENSTYYLLRHVQFVMYGPNLNSRILRDKVYFMIPNRFNSTILIGQKKNKLKKLN
jgi:hypothetical protein